MCSPWTILANTRFIPGRLRNDMLVESRTGETRRFYRGWAQPAMSNDNARCIWKIWARIASRADALAMERG